MERLPRLWHVALRLLPRRFRERHGDEMTAVLREHLRGRGPIGRWRMGAGALADVGRAAARQWAAAGWRAARARITDRGRGTMTDGWREDVAFAVRALRRRPGFAATAVATLALGIGANTVVFSVVEGVLLRPLPYAGSERIGILWHDLGDGAQSLPALHPLDLYDYRERSRVFETFALASGREWILGGADDPEVVDAGLVEAGFFEFFGVAPALGRAFTPGEDAPGATRAVILSHRIWERRWGADPGVLGRRVEVAGTRMEVVGVLPADFSLALPAEAFLLRDAEIWVPAQVDRSRLPPRNFTGFTAFGRIEPGATFAEAQQELDAMAARLREEHPVHADSRLRARVVPLHDDVVKEARAPLLVLMGAVGFLLLIACVNVANLVMVRGQARAPELGVRAALGAGRRGLVRLVMTESAVLAGLGALLGVGLAVLGLELVETLAAGSVPRLAEVGLDARVLVFAAAVAAASAAASGLAPALGAARSEPGTVLRSGRRPGASRGEGRARDVLVVGQVAATLVLLVGTGLMLRSFQALTAVDPGYALEDRLSFRISLPVPAFAESGEREAFFQDLEAALAAHPAVVSVAGASQLPLTGSGSLQPYAYDEETARNWESVTADGRMVTPGFFGTMGARLLAGRELEPADAEAGDRIVIDDRLARRAFGEADPVGRRLQVNPDDAPEEIRWARVVGVVDHMRLHDLSRDHLTQIWFPMRGAARFSVVVRTTGDASSVPRAIRSEVARLAPGAPVEDLRPMADLARASLAPARLTLALMGVFGAAALLLASVGTYGVLSYAVGRRTREIGVRMALGQEPGEVRSMVLRRGMRLVAGAVLLGLAGAAALRNVLDGILFGVDPLDLPTYAVTAALLAVVALAACWIPARRATRVDPVTALR